MASSFFTLSELHVFHFVFFLFQMRISYDDQFLFSVGLDGSLFMFRLIDKEGRGLKREKDVSFAEEVLVTKTDMEEKVYAEHNVTFDKVLCFVLLQVHDFVHTCAEHDDVRAEDACGRAQDGE